MTSFDGGLVAARTQQIRSAMARGIPRRVAGFDRATREDSWLQAGLHVLGKGEEIPAKILGRLLFPEEEKYQTPLIGSNSATTASFSDLLTDSGWDPLVAAVAGLGLAIANPIDPLNKLNVGRYTRLGEAGKLVAGIGGVKALTKGADNLLRVDTEKLLTEIGKQKKLLESGRVHKSNIKSIESTIKTYEEAAKYQGELNNLLVELQKRGVTPEGLTLANKFTDQIRLGQRSLIGLSSPASLEHLSLLGFGRGPAEAATRMNLLPRRAQLALAKATTGMQNKIFNPLADTVKNIANAIKIPLGKTEAVKKVSQSLKASFKKKHATIEEQSRDMESILNQAIQDGLTKQDLHDVLQALEIPPAQKSVALSELDIIEDTDLIVGRGVEEVTAAQTQFTADAKLALSKAGFEATEIDDILSIKPIDDGFQSKIIQRLGEIVNKRFEKAKTGKTSLTTEMGVGIVIDNTGNVTHIINKGKAGAGSVTIKHPGGGFGVYKSDITIHTHPSDVRPSGSPSSARGDLAVFSYIQSNIGRVKGTPFTQHHYVVTPNRAYFVRFDPTKKPVNAAQEAGMLSSGEFVLDTTTDYLKGVGVDVDKLFDDARAGLELHPATTRFGVIGIAKNILYAKENVPSIVYKGEILPGVPFEQVGEKIRKVSDKYYNAALKLIDTLNQATFDLLKKHGVDIGVISHAEADRLITDFIRSGKQVNILDSAKKLQLTPQGIDYSDLTTGVQLFKSAHTGSFFIGVHDEHEVKLLGQYVVVRAGSEKAKSGPIDELDKMFGNRVWLRHVDKDGQAWLVARRMPFSAPVSAKNPMDIEHILNLENMAAQLSAKQLALVGVRSNDFIISPNGAVQIINPDVIVKMKSSKDAVDNSRITLEALANIFNIPIAEFSYLRNTKTARSVPRGVDGLRFRRVNSNLPDGDFMHAQDLLDRAINAIPHQQYVKAAYNQIPPDEFAKSFGSGIEFERANNIEFHRQEIRRARQAGEAPKWAPLEVTQDDFGHVWVSGIDDRNRLTAAILEGMEVVPIKKMEYLGEVATTADGYFIGNFHRLMDVWRDSDNSSARAISTNTNGVVSSNYGLLSNTGQIQHVEEAAIFISDRLPSLFNRLLTLGPQFVGKAYGTRVNSARQLLEAKFGNLTNAMLVVSDLAESSPNAREFAKQLESILFNAQTGQGIRLDNVFRHPQAEEIFTKLRNASVETLDNSAKRGIFTERTVNDTNRLKLASEIDDYVVQSVNPEANTITFTSSSASRDHLKKTAESFLSKTTTPADVDQYAKVILNGPDGVTSLTIRDFVKDPHPKFFEQPVRTIFRISDSMKDELAEKGIFVVNADSIATVREDLSKRGLNFGVLLSKKEIKGVPKILRPEFAYFITKSGDIFIGTKHDDVRNLFTDVFKEGPKYSQEFGIMTTGKIIMSNLFGSDLEKLGAGELKLMVNRLKDLAGKFKSLGFSEGTVLQAHTAFDNAVWRAMYGERTTIGDILKDDFKLRLPDEMKGHAVDKAVDIPMRYVDIDTVPTGVVATQPIRLANPQVQKLFDAIRDIKDNQFLEEAKAALPVSYYESYFGRYVTKDAREAMQKYALQHPDKNSQSFKNIESFFHGRLWTDLTTLEINQVLKQLAKVGHENPEEIIVNVVKKMRDDYVIKPDPEQARALLAVSRMLPEGIDFFYTHPMFALSLRVQQGIKAITRSEVVKNLKDMGVVVWHGTAKELQAARIGSSAEIMKLEKEIKSTSEALTKAQLTLNELMEKTPDIKSVETVKLKEQIDKLVVELANLMSSKAGKIDKLGKGKIMDTMVDLNAEEAWITGEASLKLVNKGILKEGDILGDVTDSFVRIPIKKYESFLSTEDAEVFLFPREVAAEVQRYFSSTTKEGFEKFLALWDEVHAAWRAWTLFPIPSYHIRNGISNMFMAYLGGVTDPEAYRLSMQIMQLMTSHRKGALSLKEATEALESIGIASANGNTITARELLSGFIHNGGLSGGLHHNEYSRFGDVRRQSDFMRLVGKSGLHPASELSGSWIFDNVAVRGGVAAASFVENRFRLAAFIDSIRRGHVERNGTEILTGMDAAAIRMKKIFYDYTDMSAFEQSWLRRVFPFYSWSRHNVPRMLTTLITEPSKHYRLWKAADDLERGVTGGEVTEAELPEWIRNRYGLIISKTANGSYIVKTADGFLPMTDAYKALSRGGIISMMKDGLTPFVKVPIEQMANLSFYSNQQIEKFPGQTARSFTLGEVGFTRRVTNEGPLGPLNILLNESLFRTFFRPGGEFVDKLLDPIIDPRNFGKEKPGIFANMLALFIGRAYTVDPEKAKLAFYRDWQKREGQIMALRNAAQKVGDITATEQIDSMLNWLRLGYPGKEL